MKRLLLGLLFAIAAATSYADVTGPVASQVQFCPGTTPATGNTIVYGTNCANWAAGGGSGSSTNITGILAGNGSTISAAPQFLYCTNGSSGSADAALLAAAATAGGNITLMGNCTVNATTTLISNTTFNLNGFTVTGAAAANWPSSTVAHFFATSTANNVIVGNGTFTCPSDGTGAVHILQFVAGSHIKVVNNVFNGANACGDSSAFVGASDILYQGNTSTGMTNVACADDWNGTQYVEEAGNYCETSTTASNAVYGTLATGFNTNDSAGELTEYFNIHDNKFRIRNQSGGGDVAIYAQGYSSCTGAAADWVDAHDNQILFDTGIWGEAFRAAGCANHDKFHDNVVLSDGTASSLPAGEAKGTTTDIHIDSNHAYNFSAPTSGTDLGVWNNESTNGTLLYNTCSGASCSLPMLGGAVASTAVGGIGTVPYDFAIWGVPVIIPSSGSMGNNGALTITTALPATITKAYFYLPAGAISSGSAAGVWYGVCSSTTLCTIYNNQLTSGAPVVITSPTAFATTGPGAYTQTTSSMLALVTIPVTGGLLGADGYLYIKTQGQRTNNADTIEEEWTYGGTELGILSTASVNWFPMIRTIGNSEGNTGIQPVVSNTTSAASDESTSAGGVSFLNISTASTQNFVVEAQINTATDWFILYRGTLQVNYAP